MAEQDTAVTGDSSHSDPSIGPSRRGLFAAAGAAAAAGVAGWSLRGAFGSKTAEAPDPSASPTSLPAADARPGITTPAVPQRHIWIGAVHMNGDPLLIRTRALAGMQAVHDMPPDAGDVTVTIGFDASLAGTLFGAEEMTVLPAFAHDAPDIVTGGQLLVQVCAETAAGVAEAAAQVCEALGTPEVVWEQTGFRDAPTLEGTTRTGSGFIDGIINPRTSELLSEGVWSDPVRRHTHVVVRRMRIDPAFGRQPVAEQELAIGRRRDTGAPLSGGGPMSEIDLFAKTADGQLLTPSDSHVRRAHPANLAKPLMLRRSYSYVAPDGASGLIFIAFVADPQTFIATQRRLDEADAFISHTTTDASGLFFVPGDLL